MRNKLEKTCQIARNSLEEAFGVYKQYNDRKGRTRNFSVVGQRVLVLLPTEHNKLTLQWKGPYEMIEVINKMDYKIISIKVTCKTKIYHANLLKQYLEIQYAEPVQTVGITVIEAEDQAEEGAVDDEQLLDISNLSWNETYQDARYNPVLTDRQTQEAKGLVREF